MKKIDLYEIAIKILGIYLISELIYQLREIGFYITLITQKNSSEIDDDRQILTTTIIGFLVLTYFVRLLIFKSNKIAKFITNKSEQEEDFKITTNRKTIFEISLVIVGLLSIVIGLPSFLLKLKNYIIYTKRFGSDHYQDDTFLTLEALKIGIGLIAIIFSENISTLLTKDNKTLE